MCNRVPRACLDTFPRFDLASLELASDRQPSGSRVVYIVGFNIELAYLIEKPKLGSSWVARMFSFLR